jgi:hypothetical protein
MEGMNMANASSPRTPSAAWRATDSAGTFGDVTAAASGYDALRRDLIDPCRRPEAAPALESAKQVVDALVADLQACARRNAAYAAPVLMLSFDKATFGDEPVAGETHFSTMTTPGLAHVLSFKRTVTAADAVTLFIGDDVRVALMVVLLDLARLYGGERSRKDDQTLAESVGHLGAALRDAMTVL